MIPESPDEVHADAAEHCPAEVQGQDHVPQVGPHQHHVGGLDRHLLTARKYMGWKKQKKKKNVGGRSVKRGQTAVFLVSLVY